MLDLGELRGSDFHLWIFSQPATSRQIVLTRPRFARFAKPAGISGDLSRDNPSRIAGRVHRPTPPLDRAGQSERRPAINPNRPWIGSRYLETRIFVLGESYTGAYTDDLEYDDAYLAALLAGKPVPGPDLFYKMADKLGMSLQDLWQQVIFTNLALGSLGETNATKVGADQLEAGKARFEGLLRRHEPRGVLILGVGTGRVAKKVCDDLGIRSRTVYHPSGINNRNPKTACTPSMLREAWSQLLDR